MIAGLCTVDVGFAFAMQEFEAAGGKLPAGLWEEISAGLKEVEDAYGGKFADPSDPLLVSVRSGAAISMPGE